MERIEINAAHDLPGAEITAKGDGVSDGHSRGGIMNGPYVVTIDKGAGVDSRYRHKRHAFPSLRAAKDHVLTMYCPAPHRVVSSLNKDGWKAAIKAIESLPSAGGKVGPLPDGTVIEVEREDVARPGSEGDTSQKSS